MLLSFDFFLALSSQIQDGSKTGWQQQNWLTAAELVGKMVPDS